MEMKSKYVEKYLHRYRMCAVFDCLVGFPFPFCNFPPQTVNLTLSFRTTYISIYLSINICRTAPLTSRCCILYIIQQIYVQNILNMVYTLRFFSSNCHLFHNATFFGSCVINILYRGCAKIKKKSSPKGLMLAQFISSKCEAVCLNFTSTHNWLQLNCRPSSS